MFKDSTPGSECLKELIIERCLAVGLSVRLQECSCRAGRGGGNLCLDKQWTAPSQCCTHSSAEHLGPWAFPSLRATPSHWGRPFRLQLSHCSTAHLSLAPCFYPKCPYTSTSVYIFSMAAWHRENVNPTPALVVPFQISPNERNAQRTTLNIIRARTRSGSNSALNQQFVLFLTNYSTHL